MLRFVSVYLLGLSVAVSGCATVKVGANCELISPPDGAGVDGVHQTLLKIYPRKSSIGDSYSGCQTVWVIEDGRWSPVMVGIFEKGQLTRMRFPSKPNDPVEQCLMKSSVLVHGDRDICSAMDAFPYSSAPQSCLDQTSTEEATTGSDCTYD
jgi:hypothetical protein